MLPYSRPVIPPNGNQEKISVFGHKDNMEKRTPPRKQKNRDMRQQEHLSEKEVQELIKAAKKYGKANGERDALMINLMYIHGLRVTELVGLVWDDFNFKQMRLYPRRAKNGINTPHPITREEEKLLKGYQRRSASGKYLFPSRKNVGVHLSERSARRIVQVAGREAGLGSHVHPHMLRHSCGFHMVNKGIDIRLIQAYLGHSSINSTVLYTAVQSEHFEGIW